MNPPSAAAPHPDSAHAEPPGNDYLIRFLRRLIRIAVRVLAVMMVGVIFWGVVETGLDIYSRLRTPTTGHLNVSDILTTFGAFMAVLIAIVFDFHETSPASLFGAAAVVLALGVVYWLVVVNARALESADERDEADAS